MHVTRTHQQQTFLKTKYKTFFGISCNKKTINIDSEMDLSKSDGKSTLNFSARWIAIF